MSTIDDRRGEAARPVAGRLFHAGGRVFVLDLPLPSSLPIPLDVVRPAGFALLTWAFACPAAEDPDGPRALLVLAAPDAAWRGEGGLTVATHFRELAVAPAPAGGLSPEHRMLLARAVLSSVAPALLAHWPDLVGLVGEAADAVPETDAPGIAFHDSRSCTLAGTDVPNYLLLRAGTGRSLARVATASLSFGDVPGVRLGLDPAFDAAPDGAVALFAHGFTVLRPRAA